MENKFTFNGKDIDIPPIARGETVPYIVQKNEREEYLRKRAERKADLYFVGGLLGTLAGTILGWVLAKYC